MRFKVIIILDLRLSDGTEIPNSLSVADNTLEGCKHVMHDINLRGYSSGCFMRN